MEYWRLDEELAAAGDGSRGEGGRRRTFAGLALAFILGVAWGLSEAVPVWGALGVAGAATLVSLGTYGRRWTTLLLAAAMVLLGAADARMTVFGDGPQSLGRQLAKGSEFVRFQVLATEDAVLRPAGASRKEAYVFRGRIEALNRTGTWRTCGDEVRVVLQGPTEAGLAAPRYGEVWEMQGIVEAGHVVQAGLFRLPRNEATVGAARAWRVSTGGGNAFSRWCAERRRACRRVLAFGVEDRQPGAAMVQALLLGYRQDIPGPLRDDFSATGSIHIFAISGAHVGIICTFVLMVLRAFCVPLHRRIWWLAPVLGVYVAMTGAAASAVRAAIMLACLHAAPAMRRRPDTPTALAAAAFLILLVSPGDLADIGFVLSFAAVWGIMELHPVFWRWKMRLMRRDPWLPPERKSELDDAEPWHEIFIGAFLMGLSVWVATAPMTAYFFNLVSPIGLLMNVLVVPAAFLILMAGVLALLASVLHPVCAIPFAQSAAALADGLAAAIGWAAEVPGGHFFASSPPLWGVALWVAAIVAGRRLMRRWPRGACTAMFAALAALAAAFFIGEWTGDAVYVLDAAPGQAVVVKQGRHVTMVDAGPAFKAVSVLRQLRGLGVNRIDRLVLSHADAEHTGGAQAVLDALPVGEVWVPRRVWNCAATKEWLAALEARTDVPPSVRYQAGDSIPMAGGATAEVLWPPPDIRLRSSDDAALLLRISWGGRSVLVATDFGGDMEGQYLVLSENNPALFPWPSADVLVLGRNGAADASTGAWLDATGVGEAVGARSGSINARTPAPEVLDRLRARGIPLACPEGGRPVAIPLGAAGGRTCR